MERTADIFVVVGGPAGLAIAVAARQRGLEVTVADGRTPPLDKPCGEGLTPHGLRALQRIGISLPSLDTQRFRGIRFVNAGTAVDATFPNGFGLGVRRTNLHRIMVEHAERAGVLQIVETPAGEKQLRYLVNPESFGVGETNALSEQVQASVLEVLPVNRPSGTWGSVILFRSPPRLAMSILPMYK